ncbi:MAG TPA: zinc ABC transporter substrate-binding protein [Anaerolineales bacterium]|nr:zinc ABC transporter substrate-binding protein [Anaerolineales bacterium]
MRNKLVILCVVAILLAGCAPARGVSAQPGQLRVLATETFLGDIAQNVAGRRLHVDVLLSPGIDPHEFQPAPQDELRLAQSQVLIVNGVGYESWLTQAFGDAGGQRRLVVATNGLTAAADPSGEHPEGDPHMWMNPLNVIRYVENIRDGLTQADPAGKDTYAANADTYVSKLRDLDGWVKSQVAGLPKEKRLLVTNHDALAYFAKAYDFQVVGLVIPSVSNEAAPSAQQMAALIDTIKHTGAPAIFLDVSENQNLARQIASATGVKVVTDLYVETVSAPNGPAPTYVDMIQHDVEDIVGALK